MELLASSFGLMGRSLLLALAALATFSNAAFAQPALETKQRFVAALIRFMEALPGTYGDEGPRLVSSLDEMEAGLRRWDAGLRAYESAMREQLQGAQPAVAAALRMPLGAVLLERGRFDDALREFEEAAQLEPQRADAQMFRGFAYQAAGRPSDATRAFRAAWQIDPMDPIAAYLVARAGAGDGRSTDLQQAVRVLSAFQRERLVQDAQRRAPFTTVSLLEESAGNDPEFPPALYADGFASIRAGRYEEALVRLRAAVAADPMNADVALNAQPYVQGILALRGGRPDAAIRELQAAVEMNPGSSSAHRALGTAFRLDQQYSASIDQFGEAIRLRPTDERSRLALAEVLVESGQRDRVEQTLRDAIQAIPGSGTARWKLGQIFQTLSREEDSLPAFEEAASFPTLAGEDRIQAVIGTLYLRKTDFDRAIVAFKRRLEGDLNSSVAHRELGDAYRQQGRQDEAVLEYLAALLIDPADAEACAAIGQIQLSAGRYDDAIEILQRAVNLKPQHKEARYALANALVRLGKMDEGKRELEVVAKLQAEALDEEHRSYELNQLKLEGSLRFNEGKYEEAASLWRRVVDRQPDVASNYASLGQALAKGAHHEAAIESFERALGLGAELELHNSIAAEHEKLGQNEAAERERALYRQLRQEQLRQLGSRQ
jgi:tetratricopeptide (TPR) repeat protein